MAYYRTIHTKDNFRALLEGDFQVSYHLSLCPYRALEKMALEEPDRKYSNGSAIDS
jgi:hypothetical protein